MQIIIGPHTACLQPHISAMCMCKNYRQVLRRLYGFAGADTIKQLYVSLVRPHLEYGNAVWHPHLKKHSQAIEKVQRRATKLLPWIKNQPYTDRLKILKLPSLHYRRIRGDLIQAYKIFHNIDDIEVHKFFQFCDNSTRGHNFKINKQSYKILLKATRELLQQQSLRVVEQAHR